MANLNIADLLTTESEHIKKLNSIVLDAIEEEKLLSEKIYEFEDSNISLSGRIADNVAQFGGSWTFIISFVLFMAVWIGLNNWLLKPAYDPYPYILLNLLLSTIAALQAPIIIMSQNRKEEKTDKER